MVTEFESGDGSGLVIRNPATNEPARTDEERVRFGNMQVEAKAKREAKIVHDRNEGMHPTGLAEVRNSDGSISKLGGRKPW